MTLGFSTKINGKPNYFIEKIWSGFTHFAGDTEWLCLYNNYKIYHKVDLGKPWDEEYPSINRGNKPKLHTIRQDPSNRWRAGMDIHFVINNRTKNRFQFAPVVKCVRVQTIEIEWVDLGTFLGREVRVFVDSTKVIGKFNENDKYCLDGIGRSLEDLATNDGFDSVEDFFKYFNNDFKGKLIHWTNLKY